MPDYKVIGAKVFTYKKVFIITCDTPKAALDRASDQLDEYETFDEEGKVHTQIYTIKQIGE